MVTTDSAGKREREITGVYPKSLQDPKIGGSRLAKMADEEEELGATSGHEVEHINQPFEFKSYKCELRVRAAYEQRASSVRTTREQRTRTRTNNARTTRELRARTHPRTTRRARLTLLSWAL